MRFYKLLTLAVMVFIIQQQSGAQVTANFSVSSSTGCESLVAIFKNTTSGTYDSLRWNLGNGNTVFDSTTATGYYINPGKYAATLFVYKNGVKSSKTDTIRVYIPPIAGLSINKSTGCVPDTVKFTDLSTPGSGAIDSWSWDMQNGNILTSENPTYIYTSAGQFDVVLTVKDVNGCESSLDKTSIVSIQNKPIPGFSASPSVSCNVPVNVSYTNTTTGTGTMTYNWNFGTSTSQLTSPVINYTSYGKYNVTLTATTSYGCSATATATDVVTIEPITAAGTISQHAVNITNNSYICSGNITYNSTSTGNSSVKWIFGDGGISSQNSGTYTLNKEGVDTIKLIASNGTSCSETIYWVVNVENPKAAFSFNNNACSSPDTITFKNNSVNAASYLWKFPDGSTSSILDPTHIFTVPPKSDIYAVNQSVSFVVNLKVTSTHSCLDSTVQTLSILKPTAIFWVDSVQGCAPRKFKFTSTSVSELPISFYYWNFSDGIDTVTISNSATHTFTKSGKNEAQLIIENNANCKDSSYVMTLLTGKIPTPEFTVIPTSFCEGTTLQFTDQTPAIDSVNYWQYSVNGYSLPSVPTNGNPTYTVNLDTGKLLVKQIVGYNGCYASKTQTVQNTGPFGSFTYSGSCASPLNYSFIGVIHASGAPTYLWNFGDGSTNSSSLQPSHTYAAVGDYTVKFITYYSSCTDTMLQIVRVRQSTVNLTIPQNNCSNAALNFTASIVGNQVDFCRDQFYWSFGDTTPILLTDQATMTHAYQNRGSFSVKVLALLDNGCRDSVSKTIQVYQPFAGFTATPSSGCIPLEVHFLDTSKANKSPLINWSWNFGDGKSATFSSPGSTYTDVFDQDGIDIVSLTVTDSMQCTATEIDSIKTATPVAGFSTDLTQVCTESPVIFTYTYLGADSAVWNFGDTTHFTSTNPMNLSVQHEYKYPGNYNVSLTVYKYKCSASLTNSDFVNVQQANAAFTVSDTAASCYTNPITFTALYPESYINNELWSFGDQNHTSNSGYTEEYTYSHPGKYTISFAVQTTFGCKDTFSRSIQISGPSGNFAQSANFVCKGQNVKLTLMDTSNLTSYSWIINGEVKQGNPINVAYSDTGVHNIGLLLVGLDPTCQPIIGGVIRVSSITANFMPIDTSICAKVPLQFINASVGETSQTWNFGDNTTSNLVNPVHSFTSDTFKVMLSISDTANCKDTIIHTVVVQPIPQDSIVLDKSSCNKNIAILTAIGGNSQTSVTWSPTAGLNSTSSYEVMASPVKTTTYMSTIAYLSTNCENKDSFTLFVPYAHYLHDSILTTPGDTIHLVLDSSSYVSSFFWWPTTNLSCTNCMTPIITAINLPKTNPQYYLVLNEPDGCFTDTVKFYISIDESNQTTHVPSAFRPGSNDPNNNILYVRGRGIQTLLEFKIYNRWGNLVYSSTDISEGWNGTFNGKIQPIDTYFYILSTQQYDGTITHEKGTILLLR